MTLKITDENYHAIVRKLIGDERKVQLGTNLQNLPSKGEGDRVRNCFVPADGFIFIGADLGQIEPRIMAHIMYEKYQDNSMRQIFVDGVDLYTTMAMMTFSLAEEFCVDKAYDPTGSFQPRKLMKTGVLAVAYRQSKRSFAKKMGVTEEVAEMFFENFDRTFPSFNTMVDDIIAGLKRDQYVETLRGRKRRFPDYKRVADEKKGIERRRIQLFTERKRLLDRISTKAISNGMSTINGDLTIKDSSSKEERRLKEIQTELDCLYEISGLVGYWERAAFNAVIQGTGADILKMNGNRMARECMTRGWEMNASIHDEILISVPREQLTPATIELVNEIMTKTASLSVPLVTDIVIMERWMDEHKPEEWDFENCRPKSKGDE
ncbi:DNA polymerase [Brevibacillus laterosporus]|uniref:DNA polymerase n=1 Tax=Brevibacillus laterosporus TaxID=1465 RepID=UPI000839B96D|nr:DNA polymerase [Brevibacillus laterosporus]